MTQKLYFSDSQGNKICGILSDLTPKIKKPVIILCHGFSSSKDSKTYVTLEKIFNETGLATFRFDFYGHGESDGKFEDITLSLAADSVLQAIEFLKGKNYSKIGLMGTSFGGMASLIAASKSSDLFVLTLKAPVSDYFGKTVAKKSKAELTDWKEKGFIYYASGLQGKIRLNYSLFEDSKKYEEGYDDYKKITIPTLIIHGDKDNIVPLNQSLKAAQVIPNCKLEIVKGANHFFEGKYFEMANKLISEFIIKNI